jgi:DNA processing protein
MGAGAFESLVERHAATWPSALERARATLEDCHRRDIAVLGFFDERYPQRLRAIHDPPPLLFVRGSIAVLTDDRLAAVVGTREPTSFGCSAAEELTITLASARWGVVSGLARGIDTVAHSVALKHDAPTVAIMAGGLDRIYPKENTELASAIVDRGGALVAEVPPGVPPHRSSFIARNRLQTGLSVAVIVAQTGLQGGTMHTVLHAAAQGRPLFCPLPRSKHVQSAGLWVLLNHPARELCTELPAWRHAQRLCERLGTEPLAQAVSRSHLDEFLDWLEFALDAPQTTPQPRWWPAAEPAPVQLQGDPAEADEQASLFAFVD